MTEELFDDTESNSQIYISDQLTPYFAKIFQLARVAKKKEKFIKYHRVVERFVSKKPNEHHMILYLVNMI